jgi:MYXO-CTERM domain-containing protein
VLVNQSKRVSCRFLAVAVATAVLALGATTSARAEQFVLFQQTFEITKASVDRSGSHYYVRGPMLTQPAGSNWTGPIDYRNGTVYIQTEVLEKPNATEPNHWSYCYMPNRPVGPGYGCAGSGRYTATGVYQHSEKMTAWWQNTGISWPQGIKEMHLVIKGMGDSGHLHKRSDVDKLFPSKVRIMMVQVSAGGTFDPAAAPGWVASPADGGAPAPAADGGAAPDAGGTGGAAGAGGAGGSGGAGGAGGGNEGGTGGSPAGTGGAGTGGSGAGGGQATGGAGSGSGGTGAGAPATGGSGAGRPSDPPGTGVGGSGTGGGSTGSGTRAPVTGGCAVSDRPGSPGGFALALLALALLGCGRRRPG